MSNFHFYHWNQFKVIPLPGQFIPKTNPKCADSADTSNAISWHANCYITNNDGGRGLMTSLAEASGKIKHLFIAYVLGDISVKIDSCTSKAR